jgi:hypothetical protein
MMALGGHTSALAGSTSSMFNNPAMIVHGRLYHVDAYGLYDPTAGRFGFGTAAVDSTRQYVAAGMSYFFNNVNDGGRNDHHRTHDARAVVALPIGTAFGIGLQTRFLDTQPFENQVSQVRPSPGGFTGFTFDAGVFLRPIQALTLSAAGHNLNYVDNSLAPISSSFGISLTPTPVISLVADALLDFRTVPGQVRGRYSGGVEVFIANHIPIRAGYLFDHIRDGVHAVTAGVGYVDEVWGVEMGMRQAVFPEPQTTLMLSARFFYRPPQ